MNDKTAELLAILAEKLGTTTELLWGAMLKQAPLAGAFDLGTTLLWLLGTWHLIVFVRKQIKADTVVAETFIYFGTIGVVVALMISIVLISCLPTALAAFFNPEYWALMQLIKGK